MPSHLIKDWREHLSTPGLSRVHFVEAAFCEPDALKRAGTDLGFVTIEVDGRRIGGKSDFMSELAAAARFPAYFGRNWDAVSDLLRDLSWTPAKGYVLLILEGDHLLQMDSRDVGTFIQVVETAIRDWRDERGEYNERSGPIPFHLVLCGTEALRTELRRVLTEPLCDHSA